LITRYSLVLLGNNDLIL